MADADILERLFQVIESRKGADPDSSYTAKLFHKGRGKISQKMGEEAVETVIAALEGDRQEIAAESADLLYHLLVLWSDAGVTPETVWKILEARESMSGLDEKAARTQDGKNATS